MAALTRSFPFDTGAGGNVTEAQWREMAKHWVNDGLISTVGSAMAVTATTGMVLQVAAGAAFIQGHYGALDVATNVTVSAAHATLPRIDRVVLRLDALGNAITAEVVAGTPNVSPTAPALTQTSATWEISLATVAVAAAATSIVSGNITDARTLTTPNNGTIQAPTPGAGITVSGTTVTAKNRLQLANPVRNCSGRVAQRGASIAVGAAQTFTLDGWFAYRVGVVAGMTVSQQAGAADSQGDAYYMRLQRDNGNSSTGALIYGQSIPTADSVRFAGRTVTVSFRARKGALWSASGSVLTLGVYSGTGTDQRLASGFTGIATLSYASYALTTSWQTFSVTVVVGSSATELAVQFEGNVTGTAGATDYVDVKDLRIDEGSYAMEHVPLSYAADLYEARKFYRELKANATYEPLINGPVIAGSTTSTQAYVLFEDPMRATPTVTFPAAASAVLYDSSSLYTVTALTLISASAFGLRFYADGSALTATRPYALLSNSNAQSIKLSAEI